MFEKVSSENLVVDSPLVIHYESHVPQESTEGDSYATFIRTASKTYRFIGLVDAAARIAENERVAIYTRPRWFVTDPRDGDYDVANKTGYALQAEIIRRRNDNGSWDLCVSVREKDVRYGSLNASPQSIFSELERSRDYEESVGSEEMVISVQKIRANYYYVNLAAPQGITLARFQYKRSATESEWHDYGRFISTTASTPLTLSPGYIIRAKSGPYISNLLTIAE